MSEFKPGDVVVHPKHGRGVVQDGTVAWGAGGLSTLCRVAADLRRLAVIDPKDREQVEHLMSLAAHNEFVGLPSWQAALREFANPKPPKPEEPTGLGAVVEDADGERWVRVNQGTGTQEWRCCDFIGEFRRWPAVNAVRVLSEGVQP